MVAFTALVSLAGPPASRVTAGAAAVDPSCALVSKAEAEAILGEPLDPLNAPSAGLCDYGHKPDRRHIVGLKLFPHENQSKFEAETADAASMTGSRRTPLAGYGEEAFSIGTFQIAVLQHGKAISVTHVGSPIAPKKLEAFVRKALSRL